MTISGGELNQITTAVNEYSPIGQIIVYMGNTAPNSYLKCDGTVYNISAYKLLAEHFKAQFGIYNKFGGNGTTTFAVPNLMNKFLKGSSSAGTTEQAGLPNITGDAGSTIPIENTDLGGSFYAKKNTRMISDGSYFGTAQIGFDASRSSAIYGRSSTVTPENMSVLFCIKYT